MIEVYRGWEIDHEYMGYSAVHPSWSEPGDWGHVHGWTVQEVRDSIDEAEDERVA